MEQNGTTAYSKIKTHSTPQTKRPKSKGKHNCLCVYII